MKPALILLPLDLLVIALFAGAALVAAWTYVGLWAGLLAAAVAVELGSWAIERKLAGRTPKPN